MSAWGVRLPGPPLTVNEAYRIADIKGVSREGRPFTHKGLVKTREVKLWQAQMAMVVRAARPSWWKPTGDIVIEIRYDMGPWIDADNPLKPLLDMLQEALGINDKWFLPRVMERHHGLPHNDQGIELDFYEAR